MYRVGMEGGTSLAIDALPGELYSVFHVFIRGARLILFPFRIEAAPKIGNLGTRHGRPPDLSETRMLLRGAGGGGTESIIAGWSRVPGEGELGKE